LSSIIADTNRNTNKLTRRIAGKKNKSAGSTAARTPHALPVSTIAPTGIEPGSDSNSRRDRPNIIFARSREELVMRTPSIVPHDAERDTYLMLDDFGGRLGCDWRETDAESADRGTLIRDLLDVQ
jgi:hypothetical protein